MLTEVQTRVRDVGLHTGAQLHVPLGRCVRFRRSAVIAWIAALEQQSGSRLGVTIGEE